MTLRVCHLITQLELGGAQRNTLYTLAHLDRERFDPSLICGRDGLLDPEATAGNWPTVFMTPLVRRVRPWSDLRALLALYRELRRIKPHIVHTHSSKAGILGRLAAYGAGVPVIVHTFHGFGFTPTQHPVVRWLFTALEKFCARLSTHLVYVSRDNQAEGEALGLTGRAGHSLIRSGISMRPTPEEGLRAEIGVPDDAWLVACVNNFKPQKNPRALMEVALKLVEQDPDIHVAIAGDGELRQAAESSLAGQPGADRIHLLGWRKDARRLQAAADMFLLTSLWEGLPRALIEAFAEGKPAVAFAVNGVRDVLKNGVTGYAVKPGDIASAVSQSLWLKRHPADARQMGRTARLLIETDFDIDRMVRAQESLYEALYDAVPLKHLYEARWVPHENS